MKVIREGSVGQSVVKAGEGGTEFRRVGQREVVAR